MDKWAFVRNHQSLKSDSYGVGFPIDLHGELARLKHIYGEL